MKYLLVEQFSQHKDGCKLATQRPLLVIHNWRMSLVVAYLERMLPSPRINISVEDGFGSHSGQA